MNSNETLLNPPPAIENGLDGPDWLWMEALLGRAGLGADPGFGALTEALATCQADPASVAARVARLATEPLDRMIIASLYLEGLHLDVRRKLRSGGGAVEVDDFSEEGLGQRYSTLSAERLVSWLGGEDQGLRRKLAERLLPQSGLAARSLIERRDASAPLDGGVRLTPFLSSLLYPGDGHGERVLDAGLRLVQPKERLRDVVLNEYQRKPLEQFLAMCRAEQGGGKAILLWGRAGTGKTLTARALAGELGQPLLLVRTHNSQIEAGLIERAAAAAQIEGAVVFFDECGRWMDSEATPFGPSPEAAMLLQMLQDHPGVVIAAMNQPWLRLSEAFQRRFTTQVSYGRIDGPERTMLWQKHLRRPIDLTLLQRAVALYRINGGLIRNAASRLNLALPSKSVEWEELQEAVTSQLHGLVDWQGDPGSWHHARKNMAKESRSELQRMARVWRRNGDLAYETRFGVRASGFKALLQGPIGLQFWAVSYLAKCLRRKAQTINLNELLPKDAQKRPMTASDLKRSVEACSLSGGLPVLEVMRAWNEKEPEGIALTAAFTEAGGFGVVCTVVEGKQPGCLQPESFGPWIALKPAPPQDLRPFEAGGRKYKIQADDLAFAATLRTLPNGKMQLVYQWALAKQRVEDPGAPPDAILEKFIRSALALLTKPISQNPIF